MQAGLWPSLDGRRVLLGISGGVAAYKAAELCRLLVRCGAQVSVALTPAGRQFVGEATLAALSGRPVATELFDPVQEAQIGHIRLADEAEVLVVAPATADLLAKLSCGLAGDVLTTAYLAFDGPVLLAPAMNVKMWQHPATRANVATLRTRGHRLVGPATGEMACGHVGAGRMAEPEDILQAVGACLAPQDFAGRRVLVAAGPTREAIDPVRYLSNRSTGKMGYALALEAAARGAAVTLISGPTALPQPLGVATIDVLSAEQMGHAVEEHAASQDVVVMAAAVADYRPAEHSEVKLRKEKLGVEPALPLACTTDILATLGERRTDGAQRPFLVGFAAEDVADDASGARAKLHRKRCEMLVVNDVTSADAGFEVDQNRVTVYGADGSTEALPLASKRAIAAALLDRIAARFSEALGAGDAG